MKPTFTITRHRYADETNHKCIGTGVCGYCKPDGFDGTAGESGNTTDQDPYEAQGKDFRVNHPTQPKTQVEKWREEIEENRMAYITCISCGDHECYKCLARLEKMQQLRELISQATKPIHPRYPTGEFGDDIENAPEYIKKSLFGYNFKKVTLLDKIKLWLKK